jgi:hypothetical protein
MESFVPRGDKPSDLILMQPSGAALKSTLSFNVTLNERVDFQEIVLLYSCTAVPNPLGKHGFASTHK